MNRWKASLLHLGFSALLVGAFAAFVVGYWYPVALMKMAHADKLLLLVAGIDLVVGPLLTLVIFKPGKPGLKFDLTVIALLQACFLAYGVFNLTVSRPVFLVADGEHFDLVFANDLDPAKVAKGSRPEYRSLPLTGPLLVGARLPDDPKTRMRIVESALSGKGDIESMPEYYAPYEEVIGTMLPKGKPLVKAPGLSDQALAKLVAAARRYGRDPASVRYFSLSSSRGFAGMLVDAANGAVVGPVNVDL